jgi:type II secretory pathway pseudopilin PulG
VTLIELLAVLAIIALLAALAFPFLSRARAKADMAAGLSNLHQVGMALQSYLNDNNQSLPLVWSGQTPQYQAGGTNTLGFHLWQYLGLPAPTAQPQEAKVLGNPAYFRVRPAKDSRSLYLNYQVLAPDPKWTGEKFTPWGDPGMAKQTKTMLYMSQVGLAKTWAMVDVDKTLAASPPPLTPPFTGNWWVSTLPAEPVYGQMRTFLYFDWSAKAVPVGSNP